MSSDDIPALSIGAIFGDPGHGNMLWKDAINAIDQRLEALNLTQASPLRLSVVFHVDGDIAPNEFTGIRTGRYSSKDRHLIIQAAVPLGPVQDREQFLLMLLSHAVDEAEKFAETKHLSQQGLPEIREIVRSII
jgi:hypothetical protein